MTLVRGVDISSAQTVTSWASLAKAVDFVIVKATEGVTFTSPTFYRYYAGSKNAKVLTGSYHYAHPKNNALSEARHYVAALKKAGFKSGVDMPPALDVEETEGKSKSGLTTWCLTFLHEVDRLLNLTVPWLKCGVYLNNDYYRNRLDGFKVCDGRWKWLAYWPIRNSTWPLETTRPVGAAVWQFSDRIHVGGINENVDGDVAELVDLHNLAPTFYALPKPPVPDGGNTGPAPDVPDVIPVSFTAITPHKQSTAYVQRALNKVVNSTCHGGFFDQETEHAVNAWQKKLGQPQTGVLTYSQFQELANASGLFIAKL